MINNATCANVELQAARGQLADLSAVNYRVAAITLEADGAPTVTISATEGLLDAMTQAFHGYLADQAAGRYAEEESRAGAAWRESHPEQ